MNSALRHRGPDDHGIWIDADAGVGLAHRRLSILDLSPQGHQPMVSASERYVIAYNGEVYNFNALRQELESLGNHDGSKTKFHWRGHSDTEVLLAAIEHWGLESAVKKFIGMFAFALWDRKDRLLHLVRDRIGIKPLYYGWQGETFLFGSELKALKEHPDFQGQIDRDSLALLIRHNYVPSPYSIYQGICKLLPGHILTLNSKNRDKYPKSVPYWSALEVAENGLKNPFEGSENDAIEQLDLILRDAVKLRMVSDVPLGAFLSGGIDSSTVVALMQAQSNLPVKTFSIGFNEKGYDEAKYAKQIARHLGTDHTELYLEPEQAMAIIPRLPTLYDEPFSDSSQIPTFLVSELARQKVTVSLSGDGGDELFGGYTRYQIATYAWSRVNWLPSVCKTLLAKIFTSLAPGTWNSLFGPLERLLPFLIKRGTLGDKLHLIARYLPLNTPETFYQALNSHSNDPESFVIGSSEPPTFFTNGLLLQNLPEFAQKAMLLDTLAYLPDDILTKVDRASMGVSLEARVPLLDHRVAEFAWKLPSRMKIKNGDAKWILRQVLYKYVPKEMMERPKMGFGVPIDSWLRGPLRDWAEALLDEKRLLDEGYFQPAIIRKQWTEYLRGEGSWHYPLWDVLMFQAWLEENRKQTSKL